MLRGFGLTEPTSARARDRRRGLLAHREAAGAQLRDGALGEPRLGTGLGAAFLCASKQEDDVGVHGVARAADPQHSSEQSSDTPIEVENLNVAQQISNWNLALPTTAPYLRHDARGSHQRGPGCDKPSHQRHHDGASTFECDEGARVEHDPGFPLRALHAAVRRRGLVKRLNNVSARRSTLLDGATSR